MTSGTRLMTTEELLQLPDDGNRYELIRGELKTMSPAGNRHGRIAGDITVSLGVAVRTQVLGKVFAADPGFILATDPDHVRAPDVAFISRQRLNDVGETDGYWPGAPDLAVEIISPNDRYTDVEEKVLEWLAAGTSMVIVVNPRRRSVRIHRSSTEVVDLNVEDTIDGSDVVPGWELPVAEIFED